MKKKKGKWSHLVNSYLFNRILKKKKTNLSLSVVITHLCFVCLRKLIVKLSLYPLSMTLLVNHFCYICWEGGSFKVVQSLENAITEVRVRDFLEVNHVSSSDSLFLITKLTSGLAGAKTRSALKRREVQGSEIPVMFSFNQPSPPHFHLSQ